MNKKFKKSILSVMTACCAACLPFEAFCSGAPKKLDEEKKPFKNVYSEIKLGNGEISMMEQCVSDGKDEKSPEYHYEGEGFNAIEGNREKVPSVIRLRVTDRICKSSSVPSLLNSYDIVIFDSGLVGPYWFSHMLEQMGISKDENVWKKEILPLDDFCAQKEGDKVFQTGYKFVLTNTLTNKKLIFYFEFGNIFSHNLRYYFDVRAEYTNYNGLLSKVKLLNPVSSNGAFPIKIKKAMIGTFFLGERVQGTKEGSFSRLNNLTNFKFYGMIENIGDSSFYKCVNLKSVSFEKGVKKIGNYVFQNCSSLININFPEGLKTMGEKVFLDCGKLKYIFLPKSLEEVCLSTFDGAPANVKIIYRERALDPGSFFKFFSACGGKIKRQHMATIN